MHLRTLGLFVLLSFGVVGSVRAGDAPAAGAPAVDGRDVRAWEALLEAKDEDAVVEARDRLGAAGKSAVPVVAELLRSTSAHVRRRAVWIVVLLGADGLELRRTVLSLLSDPDPSVRAEAVGAVKPLVDTLGLDVLEPARKILREEGWLAQGRAADVLAVLGEKAAAAIPDLVASLAHGELYAADDGAQALLAMGGAGAEALARAWASLDDERRGHVGEGVAAAADAAGTSLVALLGSKDAVVADAGEGLCYAAGWRIVPALAAAAQAGASATASVRIARVRERLSTEGARAYMGPGAEDVVVADAPLGLDPAAVELRWESGSGHGNTLARYRTRRVEGRLFVRSIEFSGPSLGHRREKEQVSGFEWGPFPADRVAAACDVLSRVLAMRLVDRPQLRSGHRSFTSSSSDFHAKVVAQSGGRTVFVEAFTGYRGSRSHRESCRLEAAQKVLSELLAGRPSAARTPDEEDLADLAVRCASLATESWWVKERVLRTVAGIGDARFEPMLRAYIESEPDKSPWDHRAAIDAYARITGLDLRTTPFEREDVLVVRERYLARFRAATRTPVPK